MPIKKELFLIFIVFVFSCSDEQISNEEEVPCEGFLSDNVKAYADLNWSLNNWVSNWLVQPDGAFGDNNFSWEEYPELTDLKGDYSLTLVLTGELRDNYGSYVSSDSLESYPYWASNPSVSVLRDSLFYEYIRLHNQFTGGWYDASTAWYATIQFVDGKSKNLILTPIKSQYRDMYFDCD